MMALVLARFYFPEVLNFGILLLRPLSQAETCHNEAKNELEIQILSDQIDFLYLI